MTPTKRLARGPRIACALAALLGFAWGPVLGLPADVAHAAPSSAPAWAEDYDPCEYEDGPGPCYWDATEFGNQRGCSFLILADGSTDYSAPPNETYCLTAAGRARHRRQLAPSCQYDAYGHDIGVGGQGFKAGAKVAVRVNGRTLRGKLDRTGEASFRTRGVYTQLDMHAYVDGVRCEGT